MNGTTTGRKWPGIVALLLAAVAVTGFIAFMSVSGQIPKSLAYRPDVGFELYIEAPVISGLAGTSSVVAAILALRLASAPLWAPIVAATVGVALFDAVMVIAAQVMLVAAPVVPEATDLAVPHFPSFASSPPDVAMAMLGVGTSAVLARTKSAPGQRPAIAALILGAAVASYWLFNLVWSVGA